MVCVLTLSCDGGSGGASCGVVVVRTAGRFSCWFVHVCVSCVYVRIFCARVVAVRRGVAVVAEHAIMLNVDAFAAAPAHALDPSREIVWEDRRPIKSRGVCVCVVVRAAPVVMARTAHALHPGAYVIDTAGTGTFNEAEVCGCRAVFLSRVRFTV